jgi:hypothetical protein
MALERGLAQLALILSERSRTGLHDNLRTLHMSMYFLRFSCARKCDGIFFAASFSQENNGAQH